MSVAVHLTVVLPIGNREPEAGVQIGVKVPSSGSVALAVNDAAAPPDPVAYTTTSAGTWTVGGVLVAISGPTTANGESEVAMPQMMSLTVSSEVVMFFQPEPSS